MPTTNEAIKVIHCANDSMLAVVGSQVGSIRESLVDAFNIPKHAIAFVNGHQVDSTYTLEANDTLEFCKKVGNKGVARMLTEAQIRSEYVGFPKEVLNQLFVTFPHDDLDADGHKIWLESSVDEWINKQYSRKRADDGTDRVIPPSSVRIDGEEYAGLTPKEWRLLEALLRLPSDEPKVMLDDLVDHVYGHDAPLSKNPITQVIKRLNKKSTHEGWRFTIHEENGWVMLMK